MNAGLDVPNFTNRRTGLAGKLHKAQDYKISNGSEAGQENNLQNGNSELFKQKEVEKEAKTKEVLQLEHALTVEDQNYEVPPIELLNVGESQDTGSRKALLSTAEKLRKTLYSFGVSAKVENVSVGPAITR